jgi:hypothetical protein
MRSWRRSGEGVALLGPSGPQSPRTARGSFQVEPNLRDSGRRVIATEARFDESEDRARRCERRLAVVDPSSRGRAPCLACTERTPSWIDRESPRCKNSWAILEPHLRSDPRRYFADFERIDMSDADFSSAGARPIARSLHLVLAPRGVPNSARSMESARAL